VCYEEKLVSILIILAIVIVSGALIFGQSGWDISSFSGYCENGMPTSYARDAFGSNKMGQCTIWTGLFGFLNIKLGSWTESSRDCIWRYCGVSTATRAKWVPKN
jgi:hypothetical protein